MCNIKLQFELLREGVVYAVTLNNLNYCYVPQHISSSVIGPTLRNSLNIIIMKLKAYKHSFMLRPAHPSFGWVKTVVDG